MPKSIIIYLCGSIKKGADDKRNRYFWSESEENEIFESFGPNWDVKLLNPATYGIKRTDPFSNFGGDMYLVKSSDIIFVDARSKRGIGIGGEMFAAKFFGIPVVCLCPPESHYIRKNVKNLCGEDVKNWIHPFIYGLSDCIVDDIPSGVQWIKNLRDSTETVKGISVIDEAIDIFKRNQGIK